jgi:nucleotide-binding universal stress UspA family protein
VEDDPEPVTVPLHPPRPVQPVAPRIVVGVADSGAGHAAVAWAADRATKTGAELALLHVEERPQTGRAVLPRLGLVSGHDLLARETRFVRSVAPGVSVTSERLEGSVMWALAAAAAASAAEMVVVGTHKSGFIHGTVYGSTSLQLAATARCPVTVVPAVPLGVTAGIVLGADASPAGRAALLFAAAEAGRSSTDLLIVRVLEVLDDETDDASARADAAALLERFRAVALAANPGLVLNVRAIHGVVAQVLVTMSLGARMLVLGDARTDSGRDPLALGAVCHDALLNIQTPTVVVHVGDRASRAEAWADTAAQIPRP